MSARVLAAYGSKVGATAELAEAIEAALRVAGLDQTARRRVSRRSQGC
jgi:menaquinone-dependent protoporphyrinogen IX oxidase